MKNGFLNLLLMLALIVSALSAPALAQPDGPESGALEPIAAPQKAPTLSSPPASRLVVRSATPASPDASLWDQPLSSINTDAYVNQDFEPVNDTADTFIADDFTNADYWGIDAIFIPGDTWNTGCDLTCAQYLVWQIYADVGGEPDGDPTGGGNPPFWSLSLPPTDPRITLSTGSGGRITDVNLALTTPLTLPPGTWWLVFYPRMDFDTCCQYGRQPSDTTNGNDAHITNPGGYFGFPAGWTSIQDPSTLGLAQQDVAFRLDGTVVAPGWLEGSVLDAEAGDVDPPCTDAAVHIAPTGLEVPVNPTTGYYGPVALTSATYNLQASAPGFSLETATVDVTTGVTTTQDFHLRRPVIEVTPSDFVSITAIISEPVTYTLTINNNGHLPLDFEIQERPATGPLNIMSGFQHQSGIEVEPALLAQISADESSSYMIYFHKEPDLSPAFEMDWHERGWFVMNALQETAQRSQARVRNYLDAQGAQYQAFWIDNVILVESSGGATVNNLMSFPEIAALRTERTMHVIEPAQKSISADPVPLAVEANISHVNADQVWGLGYLGDGIVVANIDTGVRYTHDALVSQYRGNLGGGSFNHNYNWLDPDTSNTSPFDDHGHGSHTMGTMVGDEGATNQIGMAPNAQWIACDACNTSNCPGAALLTCAQWVVAPYPIGVPSSSNPDLRPHVVNNSWGSCEGYYDPWYQGAVDAWHAAGIYPVFSNGNAGNSGCPETAGCNTVGNPARYSNVTGVGSTGQSNGLLAAHSLWGPTDSPDTVNPRGYPNLKPQVVAPGVSIRSSLNGNDSDYASWGGTSMSAPHVSGLVALMWQAAPCLIGDYAATETLIEQTANPIPYASGCGGEGPGNVPNNATGWGEIDALAAVQAAQNYCMSWTWQDPISGTIPGPGSVAIDVNFHCTEPRDYEGILQIVHNDPCVSDIDIPIVLHCQEQLPADWDKQIDGEPWTPEFSVTRETSDTIQIVDVISSTLPFTLTDVWHSGHLALVNYQLDPPEAGSVTPGDEQLEWTLDPAPTLPVTLTKLFHVEPCTWTDTLLWEELWVQGASPWERPVAIAKDMPDLWLDADYEPEVDPDQQATFTLLYGNSAGYENDVTLWNDFPPEAPFVSSSPPPIDADPAGRWATWSVGDLAKGDEGSIQVTVAITSSLPPSTTIEIWDYIYNHVGDQMDAVTITYHIGGACEPVTGVDFEWSPIDPQTGDVVTFTAVIQPPEASTPIAYEWDFGDGGTAAGNPVYHTYTSSDIYSVQLTATNTCGDPVGASHDVTVAGSPFIPTYGVELTPATDNRSGSPGQVLTYNLTLRNIGDAADTYDLSCADMNSWTTGVEPASVNLPPGGTALVAVTVGVPTGARGGDSDIVTVTATSRGDPTVDGRSALATSSFFMLYLPVVLNIY